MNEGLKPGGIEVIGLLGAWVFGLVRAPVLESWMDLVFIAWRVASSVFHGQLLSRVNGTMPPRSAFSESDDKV